MALLKDLYRYQVQIIKPLYGENLVRNPRAVRSTTGYYSRGGAAVSIDDTHTRRGPSCLRIGGQTGESGVAYQTSPAFTLENGKPYSFSVDVLGPADMPMALELGNVAGSITDARKEFVATGNWQRVELNYQQPTGSSSSNRRISVLKKAGTTTEVFWVDGFQFEVSEKATTFILGYNTGLGYMGNRSEYGWKGLPYESVSWRSGWTRHGGALVDLAEYANIKAITGLGMSPFVQVSTPIVTGGELYQTYIRESRPFSISLQYTGDNVVDIQKKRQAVLDLVRPDNTPYDQPLVLRVQMVDARNNEAGDPVDIACVFLTSHTNTPVNVTSQTDTLSFSCLDGHLLGAFRDGATLDYRVEFDANFIVRRDPDGKWVNSSGNNPLAGVNALVQEIIEFRNKDIIAAGYFQNAGGDQYADYLAKWNGTSWSTLDSSFNTAQAELSGVSCYAVAPNGDLYFGIETIPGALNHLWLLKYNGSSLSVVGNPAVGTPGDPFSDRITCMAFDDKGKLWVGGKMDFVAMSSWRFWTWDGTNTERLPDILDLRCMAWNPQFTRLYLGGGFTNMDGTRGDYLCYYDPADNSFHDVGGTELNGAVNSIDFTPAGAMVIGGLFTAAGGDPNANRIAIWNGTNWQSLGGAGANAEVKLIYCVSDGNIYAIGSFTKIGAMTSTQSGLTAKQAAVYKNGAWQSIGIDLPVSAVIYTLLQAADEQFYVGGLFSGRATAPNPGEIEYKITASSGSANTYPEFTIVGPGRLDSIVNHATGRRIQFNDLTLFDGEEIWINLDPTNLKMTSNWAERGNVWRYLNAGSDIGDWYMQPGKNIIGVFIPDGFDVDKTKVYVQWQPKFWSLDGAAY